MNNEDKHKLKMQKLKENIDSMDKAKVIANCVKDFIISRTMKNFEF